MIDDTEKPEIDYSDRVYDKMNPEIKAKWVEALRTGGYAQGKGSLNRLRAVGTGRIKGLCCLGVLCEVGVKDGVIDRREELTSSGASYRLIGVDEEVGWVDTMPSSEISQWAGLDTSAESDLAEMNDDGNKTFAEIADYIEEKL